MGIIMQKSDETLNKAYGHIPKEIGMYLDFSMIPIYRGFKYYFLVLVRKLTR
jgi:hypothetical protein